MDNKILVGGAIGAILLIVVIVFVLIFTGIIHFGSIAMPGTTYGPGTYEIGKDAPEGRYNLENPYSVKGGAIFKASSKGGLSLSNTGVELKEGAVITIHEGGSMKYIGS